MTISNGAAGQQPYSRKLIEVDLPLDAINAESAREKSIRHGHPSTLHLWWARRPLASCRAVIFASMVDDPSSCPDEFPTSESQAEERERLHDIIRRLVRWESTDETNPQNVELLAEARWEIARSVARSRGETAPDRKNQNAVMSYLDNKALPIYDPFCGGGSIPLEAQRLGLQAIGSDLNPIAVLITKALIELPHQSQGRPPVNPEADPLGITKGKGRNARIVPWRGAAGLADDIRYFGRWMRGKAWEQIGHLYPMAELPDGSQANVIAWLWARTVTCPNPACGIEMPLLKTLQLSKKRAFWLRPRINREDSKITFDVQETTEGITRESTASREGCICLACDSAVTLDYVSGQGKSGQIKHMMTAIVAEGDRKRLFLPTSDEQLHAALQASAPWKPNEKASSDGNVLRPRRYGVEYWHELFTERQLTTLSTLGDLVVEAKEEAIRLGANENYANALSTYLALAIDRTADNGCSYARWHNSGDFVAGVFARQRVAMVWDFAEANPFSKSTQNWLAQIEWIARVVERLPAGVNSGKVIQANAATTIHADNGPVIVTDPPYYDNIDYADLSDFFYVWLRQILRDAYPEQFSGILTPKYEEMTAIPSRFRDSRQRFDGLLKQTLNLIRERCSPEFPSSIFYAYKQQEEEKEGRISTGWETMLTAVIDAGFEIVGTWPMRTEMGVRANAMEANTLASSVVLVCRPRSKYAPTASRRDFLNALEAELPTALNHLTRKGHIAPVDLAQAAIGPGMQIYSRYDRVETISGEQVTVREALAAINQVIADYDERQEGELDPPTRFCLDWMKQRGFGEGPYGEAQILAQAKNVSIEDELRNAHGLVTAQGGTVQLQTPDHFSADRMPSPGQMTAWEGCFRMAWNLDHEDGSIQGAAEVGRRMGSAVESVERLARILYNHFDRIRDSRRAVMFNNLVTSWDDIQAEMSKPPQGQMAL